MRSLPWRDCACSRVCAYAIFPRPGVQDRPGFLVFNRLCRVCSMLSGFVVVRVRVCVCQHVRVSRLPLRVFDASGFSIVRII